MKFMGRLSIALFVVFAIFVAFTNLHSKGLCIEQRRFVSETEMIDAAINEELNGLAGVKTFEDESLKQSVLLTRFLGVDDFKRRNPNCCTLVGNYQNNQIYGWYPLLTGAIANAVSLEFEFAFKDSEGVQMSTNHKQEIPVSSCARIEVEVYRNPIGRPFR